MSVPTIDTVPLSKALKALNKCHSNIQSGRSDLEKMKAELQSGLDNTDPTNESAVRSLGELKIRVELMPKFIGKELHARRTLSAALHTEIEPLWKQLEDAVSADQTRFLDRHEKEVRSLFGDRAREVLPKSPSFPAPHWSESARENIKSLRIDANLTHDPDETYTRDAVFDRRLIQEAERLLKIVSDYKPYQPSK